MNRVFCFPCLVFYKFCDEILRSYFCFTHSNSRVVVVDQPLDDNNNCNDSL